MSIEDVLKKFDDGPVTITGDIEVKFNIDPGKKIIIKPQGGVEISDGYHTMSELYVHRYALFLALCNLAHKTEDISVWKSRTHSDGSKMYPGYFIAGIGREKGRQITYHLPVCWWDDCRFPEIDVPPKYDSHTPDDVVKRLLEMF